MERKGESLGVTKAFPAQPVTQTIVSAQLHPHWSNRNPWGGQAGAQIRSASKDRKQGRRVEGQLGVGAEQEKEQGRGRPWEWVGDAARGRLPPGWGAGSRHAAGPAPGGRGRRPLLIEAWGGARRSSQCLEGSAGWTSGGGHGSPGPGVKCA